MKWEYIKGSEADFEGAPEWATLRTHTGGRSFYAEYHDKGAQIYDICAQNTFVLDEEYAALSNIPVIAERRKVENLQSRVNDAGLQQAFDTVQRPSHYNQSDIECIDAIKASMTLAEFQSYLKGNVLKYLWRYRHKNGLEDVKKAQWYINRLAAELEESEKAGAS